MIQAAAQVMIEKKLSLSWRDDLRGESHEPTSSLPVPALVNSSNGFWQLCALMSSPGLWAMGSTGSHSLSLPQPLPPSQTGLSVSSHGKKKSALQLSLQLFRCQESLLLSLCTISAKFPHTGFWAIRGL